MTGPAPARVEDFTDEPATPAGATAGAGPLVAKSYDPSPERENIRGRIAMHLLWLMAGILVTLILLLARGRVGVDDTLKLAGALLTPIVGLFGAVMGFYFGEKVASATQGGGPAPRG